MTAPLENKFVNGAISAILHLSYVVFPLIYLATEPFGLPIPRNWIDVAFIIIALMGLPRLLRGKFTASALVILFCLLNIFFLKFILPLALYDISYVAFAMEIKLFIYLLLAAVLFMGLSRDYLETENLNYVFNCFVNCGGWLAVLMLLLFAFSSLSAGQFVRPLVSGEANYDAVLLILALFAALRQRNNSAVLIIALGLVVAFSRTAILVLSLIFLIEYRTSLIRKGAVILLMLVGIAVTYYVRGLESGDIDRIYMWRTFFSNVDILSWKFLFGEFAGLGQQHAAIPYSLEWLWSAQQEGWNISGIFSFHYHSFWLRILFSYGIIGLLAVLFAAIYTYFIYLPYSLVRKIILFMVCEGFTMGLFYISNVSMALIIFLVVSIFSEKQEQNRHG